MNTGETLVTILVQISTIIGVQVSIWWPRNVPAGSPQARAYRAIKSASACLAIGYVLFIVLIGLPRELFSFLLLASIGTVPQTPLSSIALSLDRGRRLRALYSSYCAVLFAATLTWACIYQALLILPPPGGPRWQQSLVVAATLLCAAGTAFIMEAYATIRQPRAR